MKKLLVIILFSLPYLLLAQSGTSVDEYNYLTKGYAYQKEMGLDGKAGYHVKTLFTASNGLTFSGLFYSASEELRGVLVVLKRKDGKPQYLCLPNNKSSNSIKGMFENDVRQKLSLVEKEKYDKALLEFAMHQLSGSKNSDYIGETEKNISKNMSTGSEDKIVDEYDVVIPIEMENGKGDMSVVEKSVEVENLPLDTNVEMTINMNSRAVLTSPAIRGTHSQKGIVVIKVCIDMNGNIKTAKFTQRGSTTWNSDLKQKAVDAVNRSRFDSSTQKEQCGTITYKFK